MWTFDTDFLINVRYKFGEKKIQIWRRGEGGGGYITDVCINISCNSEP